MASWLPAMPSTESRSVAAESLPAKSLSNWTVEAYLRASSARWRIRPATLPVITAATMKTPSANNSGTPATWSVRIGGIKKKL